jgi:hypothetical protein
VIIHHEPVDSAAGRQDPGSDAVAAGRRSRRRRGERSAPSEHVTPVEPAAATSADELAEAGTPTVDVLPAGAAGDGSADVTVPVADGAPVADTPTTESAEGPATDGATPRRRPRRRAQRPAGEPDAQAEQVGAAG